jgi:hypothetical protein
MVHRSGRPPAVLGGAHAPRTRHLGGATSRATGEPGGSPRRTVSPGHRCRARAFGAAVVAASIQDASSLERLAGHRRTGGVAFGRTAVHMESHASRARRSGGAQRPIRPMSSWHYGPPVGADSCSRVQSGVRQACSEAPASEELRASHGSTIGSRVELLLWSWRMENDPRHASPFARHGLTRSRHWAPFTPRRPFVHGEGSPCPCRRC